MDMRLGFVLANAFLAAGVLAILAALPSRTGRSTSGSAVAPPPRAEASVYGTLAWSEAKKPIAMPSMMSQPPLVVNGAMGAIGQSFSAASRAFSVADPLLHQLDGPEVIEQDSDGVGVDGDPGAASVTPRDRKIVILDASEGTRLDPLKQKNWDLNATHVLPRLK
jgi:hypothetical protein